jgi:ribonucleoside-diphosphate reductase beta chain
MRAAPLEEQRIFLSTQIADEARHVRFFNRFYEEVGLMEGADDLAARLRATEKHLGDPFRRLFDEMLKSKVDRLAVEPEDTETLVETVTLYHMVIEGALALTGQHFIIDYNTAQGTLPGFVDGFQKVARDEHRHIAFGVRFLTDMARQDDRYREAIRRTMAESLPLADGVLDPPWPEEEDVGDRLYGREETHAFAAKALARRMKVIGLY